MKKGAIPDKIRITAGQMSTNTNQRMNAAIAARIKRSRTIKEPDTPIPFLYRLFPLIQLPAFIAYAIVVMRIVPAIADHQSN